MNVTYHDFESPLDAPLVREIIDVARRIFDGIDADDVRWRLHNMPAPTVFSARSNDTLRGFKIGYAVTSRRYYSWLGGVEKAHRRTGIAGVLMERQHGWAFAHGFEVIETEVVQENHAMQQLNEGSGFRATGMRFDKTEPRIIYRKFKAE